MPDYGTAYPFRSREAAQTVIDAFGPIEGSDRYEIETNGKFFFVVYFDGDFRVGAI